jgi:hypothetical protein
MLAMATPGGAMRRRSPKRRARLGTDHHPVLDVRMRSDDDGLHAPFAVDLVGADHGIGPDEDVLVHDHLAADDGSRVDEGAGVDLGQVARWGSCGSSAVSRPGRRGRRRARMRSRSHSGRASRAMKPSALA